MFGKKKKDEPEEQEENHQVWRIKVIRVQHTGMMWSRRLDLLFERHVSWMRLGNENYETFIVVGNNPACLLKEGDEVTIWFRPEGKTGYPEIFGCRNHTLGDEEFLSEQVRKPYTSDRV